MIDVEVLYIDDCPSVAAYLPHLEALLSRSGVATRLRLTLVVDDAHARRRRFPGSPTVRVEGVDVDASASGGDHAMACRLYASGGARLTAPPDAWVLDALRRAGRHVR
jgi:hypothetical protein